MAEKKRISDIGKFSEKSVFSLLKNAEGLGKQRVNTFAPQMSAINGCPHLLRCGVSQMESAGRIYFRRGQTESFKAFMPMDTLHPEENGDAIGGFAKQSA